MSERLEKCGGCHYRLDYEELKERLKSVSKSCEQWIKTSGQLSERHRVDLKIIDKLESELYQKNEDLCNVMLENKLLKKNNLKVDKLKSLILLTDKSVSNVEVGETQLKQWQEFIRCFPDEDATKK